jgi:hypothetical protein
MKAKPSETLSLSRVGKPYQPAQLATLRGSGPAPSGFAPCRDPGCPARRDPCSGRLTAVGKHFHPLPPPSEAFLADLRARELSELATILAFCGFAEPDACAAVLQAEGCGPSEARERARLPAGEVGGLTYTHGFRKRDGAS